MSDKASWDKVKDMYTETGFKLGPYFEEQIKTGHVIFTLARYKFATRLLEKNPKLDVLELGCSEGVGTLQLARVANSVLGIDFEKTWIDWAKKNLETENLKFIQDDFINKEYGKFDAVVSIDVIEHISKEKEDEFLSTICNNLKDNGFCIVGTPNITASPYASPKSQIGHINLYDAKRLEELLSKKFHNVFVFGMNDEVVHTGFKPMCHYLMALACNKK
jgi:2-polyprenyl-3-methyl-5-hydroxy-6-metoxy-1,4-benzoquinol methylase